MKILFETAARRGEDVEVHFVPRAERARMLPQVPEAEFSAKANALLYLRHECALYVGLGDAGSAGTEAMRSAAGAAANALKKIGHTKFTVNLRAWSTMAAPVVEGLVLADYRFDRFLAKPRAPIGTVRLLIAPSALTAVKKAVRRALIVAESTNLARNIGNLPGNLLYPETLAAEAVKVARQHRLKVTVFDEKKLRAQGFGGILAVGQGSARPPRFIVLEHRGGGKSERPVVLVGKAITFDTGGISIKPAANMEDMIFDKCGGMAVLGAMAAVARLGVKRNVVGLIASAENMPGSNAYRPGDVVCALDGKHIEIINTDAEGRVVLADAIAYARRDCRAAAIVDLATLTGACVVALGEAAAGLFASDAALLGRVQAAAAASGERVWPLPIYPEHEDQIKSEVALVKNSGGRLGGACTAAAFLKTFAEDTPWAHLDIAPVAHRDKDRPDLARGATGYGVRLLVELVESWK